MATESASILETIKRGGWEASLFTTFNATIPFYEDVLLRKLTAIGCRNNVVLMDRRQCALAYASEAARPRLAGIAYTLVPIHLPGAFHPKLGLLAGKKRASVFVGSHNLTISGFAYNREVTNHIDMVGAPGTLDRNLLPLAWATARKWISELGSDLPPGLLASAYALDGVFGTSIADGPEVPAARLMGQHPGSPGLLDQLESIVSPSVRRITVMGAFFDRTGVFLSELVHRWKDADIVIGVDPLTVWMPGVSSHPRLKFVDVGNLGNHEKPGYLHAKAIYFEGSSGHDVFASGSANPSAPAWLTDHPMPNVEAMLVRLGRDATSCARTLGMDKLAKKPAMPATALAEIERRSRLVEFGYAAAGPPLVVGIADHDAQLVRMAMEDLPPFDTVDALGENDLRLVDAASAIAISDGFQVPLGLVHVRTLLLRLGPTAVVRVLVHHPAMIADRINGAARESASQLLGQLGSGFDDISRVLPLLEKIIFSDTVSDVLRLPTIRPGSDRTLDCHVTRPDSLGIWASDVHRHVKSSLFSTSNDLGYLIDILMHRIGVRDDAAERGVDRVGRSEEEQIGQDDEDLGKADASPPNQGATDAQIAESVCKKATKLMRRMGRALDQGDRTPTTTMTLVVQLVGVLALLRELAHLELADRWRQAHTSLLWIDDLEDLLDVVARTLLANGSEALLALSDENSAPPGEVVQCRSLLLWLAWITNREWWTPSVRDVYEDALGDRAIANALLLELLQHIGSDKNQWAALRYSIDLTLPPDPIKALATERWFAKHKLTGQQLSEICAADETIGGPNAGAVALGDIVRIPGMIDCLSIAVANDGRYVSVHVGKDRPRVFDLARVRWMARI